MSEQRRIDFLLQRDGPEPTVAWVRRTLRIYRRAVLDDRHFAGRDEWRRKFIAGYCEFKRWLQAQRRQERRP